MEVHHLAGTLHMASDLSSSVTDTSVAFSGRPSLSLFDPQRKRAPRTFKHDKALQGIHLSLSLSIYQLERGFFCSTFCSYDNLPYLTCKTLSHH